MPGSANSAWFHSGLASEARSALELETKAAIDPATTTDATWAKPLVSSSLSLAFLTSVRQASVLASLPVQPVPFMTSMTRLTAGASTVWSGEGVAKPTNRMSFANTPALAVKKATSIVVVTRELMKLSASGSEQALQQLLVNEVNAFVDGTLLGAGAATATAPAGLLNGVTVSADLAACIKTFFTTRPRAVSPTWVVSPAGIGTLALTDANVPRTYRGYPIVTSPAAGVNAILVDAAAIAVADGGVVLDASTQAALQLTDAPGTGTTMIVESLWENDLAAVRAERFINWTTDGAAAQFAVVVT